MTRERPCPGVAARLRQGGARAAIPPGAGRRESPGGGGPRVLLLSVPVGLPTQAPYGFDGRRRVCYNRQAFMEGPMAHKIIIKTGDVTVEAVLNNSPTAKAVWGGLPIPRH